ncbi:ATP-binding protein [Streptomyces sp. SID3343]|uniref:ATP-binding protein n=1 Tax=Streptomyces sp. SID3343 TaxID=2690260 RepID=UPI00136FF3AE|nr:ATP-binding protein [Streptomyces sp. SID3343]MYV97921.1 AAA family ATPase [Streptomyces sp. SID3343]
MTARRMAPRPQGDGQRTAQGRESTPLFDRDRVQGDLLERITSVHDLRRTEVAVVTGDAGLGKSALLDWAVTTAEAMGFTTLQATGYELDQLRVYGLVKRLFQDLYDLDDDGRMLRLGKWYGLLAPIMGMSDKERKEAPDPNHVMDALDAVMDGYLAARRPMLLVVDDAQWSDPPSLRWLANLATQHRPVPVLILVAYRPKECDESLDPALRALDRVASRSPSNLVALSPESTDHVVRRHLSDRHVDPEFTRHCHEASSGRPQLLRELLRYVVEKDIPPTAEALIEHGDRMKEHALTAYADTTFQPRFAKLGTHARKLSRAVAILNSHASIDLAAQLVDIGLDEAMVARTELIEADVLKGTVHQADFTHPLVRGAVYHHCIRPHERSDLHDKAARLLEKNFSAQTAASHLLNVPGRGDEWAVKVLCKAARECLTSGVADAGIPYLDRAREEPPPTELQAQVYYDLGRAHFVNNPIASVAPLRIALYDCEAEPDMRTNIILELARSHSFSGHIDRAVELLDKEVERTPPGPLKLQLYANLFRWAAFWENDHTFSKRSHNIQRLTARLRPKNSRDRTAFSLFALMAWYSVLCGRRLETTTQFARDALGAEVNGRRPGLSWVEEGWGFEIPMVLTLTFVYCDLFDEADDLLTRGVAELKENGRKSAHLSYGHAFKAMLEHRRGNLALAREQARTGMEMAMELGEGTPSKWYASGVLIQTLIAQGEFDEAERVAKDIGFDRLDDFPNARIFPVPGIVFAELRIAQGRHDEVIPLLRTLGRKVQHLGMDNPAWCPWGVLLAQALNAPGPHQDREEAKDVARAAVSRADSFYAPVASGHAKRVAGEIDDSPQAQQWLWDAAVALEGVGAKFEYAKALFAYGDRLRKDGHKQDAIGEFIRARDVAKECGADPLRDRAADMVEALREVTAMPALDDCDPLDEIYGSSAPLYTDECSPYGIPCPRDEPQHEQETETFETWPFGGDPSPRPDQLN